jgi:hypothetical protein
MVTRTRFDVLLYVLCLSCYVSRLFIRKFQMRQASVLIRVIGAALGICAILLNKEVFRKFLSLECSTAMYSNYWKQVTTDCVCSVLLCDLYIIVWTGYLTVGIATGCGLDGPRIESRWGGEIFRTCPDQPWAQPASCAMGTGSFPWVKSGRDVTLTPHPF